MLYIPDIEKNTYLPSSTQSMELNDVIYEFNHLTGYNARDISDIILALLGLCKYVTLEELFLLYPQQFALISQKTIPQLLESGLIESVGLTKPEGNSREYFKLTSKGYKVGLITSNGVLPKLKPPRKERSKENKSLFAKTDPSVGQFGHEYCGSYVLFQMLLLKIQFTVEREVSADIYDSLSLSKRRKAAGLYSDFIFHLFYNTDNLRLYYIEADTGSESTKVLLDKLEKYSRYGDMSRKQDVVVYAIRTPGISDGNGKLTAFSWQGCNTLLSLMVENNIFDAYDVLSLDNLNHSFRNYLELFLNTVGAAYVDSRNITRKGKFIADQNFVRTFRDSSRLRNNPYQQRGFNIRYAQNTFNRLFLCAKILLGNSNILNPSPATINMLRGFQTLFLPSTLIADRIPFSMLGMYESKLAAFERVFSKYFGRLLDFEEISKDIKLSEGTYINLRNTYNYHIGDQTGLVSIEFPFMDLSAWLRAYFFKLYYKSEKPVNIICVFETHEQASIFFKLIDYMRDFYVLYTNKSNIFGFLLGTLELNGNLFIPYENTEKKYDMHVDITMSSEL